MVFVGLAVVVYFGMQTYWYLVNPITTTAVYPYVGEDSVELNGWFVRDEEAVDCGESLLELERAEGERVAAGKVLATVYQSAEALSAAQEARRLHGELEQLTLAQSAANDAEAALRLDAEIEGGMVALRAALCRGDYDELDASASALKTTVLRREYAYRDSAELSDRAAELEGRIQSAEAAAGGTAQTIRAPFAGTYSAVVDGYEAVLTPDALRDITPEKLEGAQPGATRSTVGKLIRGNTWYYAAAVDAELVSGISEGKRLTLRVPSGVDMDLPVTVASVGRESGGQCVVVLRGSEYLAHVTMLRRQSAELILRAYSGLRIPKNALRVDETGQTGVYCLIGLSAYFKPVEVLYQGEDFCLVRPGEIDASTQGQATVLTLRANDEVIVSAGELYNGKVVGKS